MLRVALAQLNFTVGDVDGNVRRIRSAMDLAAEQAADVVALPELAVTGYPPEDLLLKRDFVLANRQALQTIAAESGDALTIVGFVDFDDAGLYNAAAVCHQGRLLGIYRKQLLPNYGVFDEHRYFRAGTENLLIRTERAVIGVCVCEDAWSDSGPVVVQADAGAQAIININASPFHKNKLNERAEMLAERARRANAAVVYVNVVGGQDELVFDGGSLVLDAQGDLIVRWPQFEERVEVVEVPVGPPRDVRGNDILVVEAENRRASTGGASSTTSPFAATHMPVTAARDPAEEIYEALVLALRDYVRKNGFGRVVIGLSGGIDSALTAAIAADALGPDAVLGVAMPSEFSSSHSIDDAKALAENLGIEMIEIPIRSIHAAYLATLGETFGDTEPGLAEENLQARARGNILMAISNRYGHLVLATGNKSEMACGYATLYGDMAGGFALLKDVFKTDVYRLSRWRNLQSAAIPENVLVKPPSAELRHDQKDTDSLPPYDVLDPILEAYIEDDASPVDIVAAGADAELVDRIIALVDRAEYKRRQAAPGPKVTTKAFGRDRRLPITNGWRGTSDGDLPQRSVGGEGHERR